VTTATLAARSSIAAVLSNALGEEVRSASVESHPYAASHLLVNVDAELTDGRRVSAVVKETATRPLHRPKFVHRPCREREVYQHVLDESGAPVPRLLGVAGPYVVLERLAGVPLWEAAGDDVAQTVGKTLRSLVDALAGNVDAECLLRYDAVFYRRWLRRACLVDPELDRLADVYTAATARLLREPETVVHGELYPSNVLVGNRVAVVDWESAGVGPTVIDLAAVVSAWPEQFECSLLDAYGPVDHVALDCARLHLAVRWLGWSSRWAPPPEHATNWRAEAERAARRLQESL
jgi:hypothetical protein